MQSLTPSAVMTLPNNYKRGETTTLKHIFKKRKRPPDERPFKAVQPLPVLEAAIGRPSRTSPYRYSKHFINYQTDIQT